MCAVKYFQNHRSRADCFYTLFSVLRDMCWQSIWYLRMASPSNPHLPIYILPRILSLKKPPFWNFTLMDEEHSTSYIASRFLKYLFCLWKQESSTFKNDHFDKLDHVDHNNYYVELSRFTNNIILHHSHPQRHATCKICWHPTYLCQHGLISICWLYPACRRK